MAVKIAIVGSRTYKHTLRIRTYMEQLSKDTVIISGGATGVDSIAAYEANRLGLTMIVYPADWNTHGKKAGYLRNIQIVDMADEVLAFWNGISKGTQHTINIARQKHKPVLIIDDNDTTN